MCSAFPHDVLSLESYSGPVDLIFILRYHVSVVIRFEATLDCLKADVASINFMSRTLNIIDQMPT